MPQPQCANEDAGIFCRKGQALSGLPARAQPFDGLIEPSRAKGLIEQTLAGEGIGWRL
jgi:hypothetical protein